MKTINIAFDCDGTLISNNELHIASRIVPNERIRTLLIALASMKNTKIIVWSGAGTMWAKQVVAALGIQKYVDVCTTKNYLGRNQETGKHEFKPDFVPDIAFDDIQDCELGTLNIIVREK